MKALSIRQPWAWLIVNGHKDIENRTWATRHRGPTLIHAAKGVTRRAYDDCLAFAIRAGYCAYFPRFEELERGGIVGEVNITDCVRTSDSLWHMEGCWGFRLADARPRLFMPLPGKLGFFDVTWGRAGMPVYVDDMRAPFRWMGICHMISETTEGLGAPAATEQWHRDHI